MYAIVFTSEFARSLSEATSGRARTVEPTAAAAPVPGPAAASPTRAGRSSFAVLAFLSAVRLLGAH